MRDLLQKAWERIRRTGRPDAEAPRAGLEARLKELLDSYVDALRGDAEEEEHPGFWIFRPSVDHEVWLQAAMVLLDEARTEGRREGAASASEQAGFQCACRCLEHGRSGCPRCLDVFACPVHSEADPRTLRPEFLREPREVARALYLALAPELGLPADGASDPERLRAWERAAREVVTIRLEGLKGG